jgi:hypothetical protein
VRQQRQYREIERGINEHRQADAERDASVGLHQPKATFRSLTEVPLRQHEESLMQYISK